MSAGGRPGFSWTAGGGMGPAGRVCTQFKIDPENATQEISYCCTPQVGRRGGRYQVAGCIKVARKYDPFA